MEQAREDAGSFQVPLDAGQVEMTQKALLAEIAPEPCRQPLEVLQGPGPDLVRGPLDVAILEQGYDVVSERALHRVLEVQDSRIVVRGEHQVPGVIVAMHEHLFLLQGVVNQDFTAGVPISLLPVGEFDAEMATAQPVAKNGQLEVDEFVVVIRQVLLIRFALLLQCQQCFDCIAVEFVRTVRAGLEFIEVVPRAEIAHQDETAFEVGAQDARTMQSHALKVAGDVHERTAVLMRCRRIHGNETPGPVADPEISAETRVARCRAPGPRLSRPSNCASQCVSSARGGGWRSHLRSR